MILNGTKDFFNQILSAEKTCYFVSPHLDDAILSCGSLMLHLKGQVKMSVLTAFTESGDYPETLSARMFLRQCGVLDAHELFSKRRGEDKKVLKLLNTSWEHLGFPDALWRKKEAGQIIRAFGRFLPELLHVYPTYRFHITTGRISSADQLLINQIERSIMRSIDLSDETTLFFPLGLGKHVDHAIMYLIGQRFSKSFRRVIFYADFPYCLSDQPDEKYLNSRGFRAVSFDRNLKEKHPLISMYATQPLFSGDIPVVSETYYIPHSLLL